MRSQWIAVFGLAASMAGSHAQAQMRYSGSDSVEPIVNAARFAYERRAAGFTLAMASPGSSVGLRELCEGKAALVGASRPIKLEEQAECTRAGITPVELPVAIDAVMLIVSRRNTQVKELKLAEIARIFEPAAAGKVTTWRAVRPEWSDTPLKTVGVNVKHGTFDFFHTAIGNKRLTRMDYKDTAVHDDTARIVAADPGAIGFVPLSVARDFADSVRVIPVDFGRGPIEPTVESIIDGRYGGLSRLLYLYVNIPAVSRAGPQSEAFVRDLVSGLDKYASFANATPLAALQNQESLRRVTFKR